MQPDLLIFSKILHWGNSLEQRVRVLHKFTAFLVHDPELLKVVSENAIAADLHIKCPAEILELLVEDVAHDEVEKHGEGADERGQKNDK